MSGFLPVDIEIFVRENRASNRRNADGFFLQVEIFYHFGNYLVNNAVRTTRALVHVVVIHEFRFIVNQVFGANYTF